VKRLLPWVIVLLGVVWLGLQSIPPKLPEDGKEIHEFGKIAIVYNGRTKPFDTIARTLLKSISEQETFVDEKGTRHPAIRWLLDVMADRMSAARPGLHHKVFRIVDPQLRDALGLPERERYRYAIDEFSERLPKLDEAMKQAHARQDAEKTLDVYDRQVLKLGSSLGIYEAVAGFRIPHSIPPSGGHSEWRPLREVMTAGAPGEKENPFAEGLIQILQAYGSGDAAKFNSEVAAYLGRFGSERAEERTKAGVESVFNRIDPFNWCKWVYVLAFVISCIAWLFWSGPLNRSAFRLTLFVLAVHTVSIGVRVYLTERGPVTNLYSSALFIGWGCVGLSLILERIYRLGVGITVATAAGFLTLMVADNLAADGDTMEVLQAVLDTRFWLWTHVTCITLGYATTFVAGLMGIIFILRSCLLALRGALLGVAYAGDPDEGLRRSLPRMIYGTICFATFFSFVGTVLGGLWADDSWGRFWGWDPKENGALLIVLWNAIILHARWAGWARERGLAMLAVFGNIVVSWSWFGVNELSVGLHTYGFTEGRRAWLAAFMVSQAVILCLGFIPSARSKPERSGPSDITPPPGANVPSVGE
jgi:ABC-type transport system involved in cytochrome c biogenesis permease subunit